MRGGSLAIFPEVAAWVTVQSSGSLAAGKWGRKKKSSKNRDAKRAGGRVKLLSEPPRNPRGGALKGENRPQNPLFEEI